ncbi:uncharacterized protein EDB91DRAFT_1253282 [Suillus paluster]|uniref:uncharacterized protein n=1 Tax=Suillus paluster TaxID=48578 RepID=UPI001B86284F|nr:uncharacterized protein EDB91DRAFT_1253282 [Suillus paluster]KAG1728857.1 hypothetical protein EDB91DRAFT_1253282 [Suillus paluster]
MPKQAKLYPTKNIIGAKDLLAASRFIKDNVVLRKLCLLDLETMHAPVIHDGTFSDTLYFFSALAARYLRQLDLSAISITRVVVPTVIEYVTSPRRTLGRLQCNANSLTLPSTRKTGSPYTAPRRSPAPATTIIHVLSCALGHGVIKKERLSSFYMV